MAALSGGWTWYLYKDHAEKFRWNCKAKNGEIVYASTQGYVNRVDCISNATNIGFVESRMVDLTKK